MNLPLKVGGLYAQKCGAAVTIYATDSNAYGERIGGGCERCLPRKGMAWEIATGMYVGEGYDPGFHRHLVREIEP